MALEVSVGKIPGCAGDKDQSGSKPRPQCTAQYAQEKAQGYGIGQGVADICMQGKSCDRAPQFTLKDVVGIRAAPLEPKAGGMGFTGDKEKGQ